MFPSTDVRYICIRAAPECDLQEYFAKSMPTSIASLIRTAEVKGSDFSRTEGVFVTDLSGRALVRFFDVLYYNCMQYIEHSLNSSTAWTIQVDHDA